MSISVRDGKISPGDRPGNEAERISFFFVGFSVYKSMMYCYNTGVFEVFQMREHGVLGCGLVREIR